VSREYATGDISGDETVPHPKEGPSEADWDSFVDTVKARWGIDIEPEHAPLYIIKSQVGV
jgi:hypothetical protein